MARTGEAISIFLYGLGSMGQGIARLAAERPGLRIVGAADIDPTLAGHDLGDVLELGRKLGVVIEADAAHALGNCTAQVVVHGTTAKLADVAPQIMACIAAGRSVVSTSEELTAPGSSPTTAALAARIDAAAQDKGVCVLAVGLNPGYVMDALPLMLSAPCMDVKRVRLRRIVDATRRGELLHRRIGAGLSVEAFHTQAEVGNVGHIGLAQSLALIAAAFRWRLDPRPAHPTPKPGQIVHATNGIIETLEPIAAHRRISAGEITVEAGQVAGIRQSASGWLNKTEAIRLDLDIFIGAPYPQDEIEIEAIPPIRLTIPGGLHDDMATIGLALNAIGAVVERARVAPGLATVADLTPLHYRPYDR